MTPRLPFILSPQRTGPRRGARAWWWGACLAACTAAAVAAAPPAGYKPPSTQVAWVPATSDAEVDRAFATARRERKPVLLYWGASWCPPCNRLKATLFNRQDFAELARSFVAVHVDGDLPGAQRVAARFKVGAYPTLVLLDAAGSEITRLPGEVEAAQVTALLQQGLAGARPAAALLADALAGRTLDAAGWQALAFYGWGTDEARLVPKGEDRAALLGRLAAACPHEATATRLWLRALAESDDGKGIRADDALRDRVLRVVGDPARMRSLMDLTAGAAEDLVQALSSEGSDERTRLMAAFEPALQRLQADASLARVDRLTALGARVELARLDAAGDDAVRPRMPAPLLAELRGHAARDDREVTDGYEREVVVTTAAWVLSRAGLWAESDALLEGNLARSATPYYLMSQLATNARRRGENAVALRWHERAWERSTGPATRRQWGAAYLGALIDLAPADPARIERVAATWLDEAAGDATAFQARNATQLQRAGRKLLEWNQAGRHDAVLQRLRTRLAVACGKVPAADGQRTACTAVLAAPARPAPAAAASAAPAGTAGPAAPARGT